MPKLTELVKSRAEFESRLLSPKTCFSPHLPRPPVQIISDLLLGLGPQSRGQGESGHFPWDAPLYLKGSIPAGAGCHLHPRCSQQLDTKSELDRPLQVVELEVGSHLVGMDGTCGCRLR